MKPYTEHDAWWHGIGLSNTRALLQGLYVQGSGVRPRGEETAGGEQESETGPSQGLGVLASGGSGSPSFVPEREVQEYVVGPRGDSCIQRVEARPGGTAAPTGRRSYTRVASCYRALLLIWLLTYPSNVLLSPPVGGCDCDAVRAAGRRRGRGGGRGRGAAGAGGAAPAAPQSALKVSLGSRTHSTIFFKTRALQTISLFSLRTSLSNSRRALSRQVSSVVPPVRHNGMLSFRHRT